MQLRNLNSAESIKAPYIVRFGLRIWSDTDENLVKIWHLKQDGEDTISYPDASRNYGKSETFLYRFHWIIDSNAQLYRIREIGSKNSLGKVFGLKRIICQISKPEPLRKSSFLGLLNEVEEDPEYHDRSLLESLVASLDEDEQLNWKHISKYFSP